MTEFGRRLTAFLMLLVVWAMRPGAVFAAAQPADTARLVRVGVCPAGGSAPFHMRLAEKCYLTEYMDRLAYYSTMKKGAPISFQYVTAKDEIELEDLLLAGKVDLIEIPVRGGNDACEEDTRAALTARGIRLLGNAVGEVQYSLCTSKASTGFYYQKFDQFNGMSVGALKNSMGISLLRERGRENGYRCNIHIFERRDELEAAIESGEIAAAVTAVGDADLCRVIQSLGKARLYLATRAGDGEAYQLLEGLQALLYNSEPYYNSTLAARYFSKRDELFEAYTQEEREFIESDGVVRIAVCEDDRPNIWYDARSGEFQGIYYELLKLMGDHSGIRFTCVRAKSWDDCLLLVQQGKADAVLGVFGLNNLSEKWDLVFSDPLITKYIAVIGRENGLPREDETQTVAITSNRTEEWVAYMREYFPAWKEQYFSSASKCFEAISKGTVDFALIDGNGLQASNLFTEYNDIHTVPTLSQKVNIVVGTSKKAPLLMQRVINKSVKSLSSAEVISCQINNAAGYQPDLAGVLRQYMPYLLVVVAVILAAFVSVVAVANHRKRYAEQKAAFFSNMSHEIRTPLNGIIGMTALARKNAGQRDRLLDCIDKIDDSGRHLLTIVNDILDLSRLEKHGMEIGREPMDLGTLLRSVHAAYYSQAKDKGVDYDTIVRGLENEFFLGDETRIKQVLMNLLSNSLKFTPPGKRIRLHVDQMESHGAVSYIRFAVCDEGAGIAQENLTKIFNAYEQQGAKTAGKYGGSGLGLPISQQLVGLMGGRLNVTSRYGVGSEFYFTLPLTAAEPPAAAIPDELPQTRCAVVDDGSDTAAYLQMLLKSVGAAPAAKEDAAVLFIDWDARQRTVEEVEALRAGGRDRRIVAWSPADYAVLGAALKAAGVDGFLEKPFFRSDVAAVLQQACGGKVSRARSFALPEAPRFPGRRVLIVEDNEINMEILGELLKPTQCAIDRAENGREALERFSASQPGTYDLIFMDVQMPEMNGYEATRAIRALERADAATVAIVAMTADAFEEDVRRARNAGMNRHLSKPVDIGGLYTAMREFLADEGE